MQTGMAIGSAQGLMLQTVLLGPPVSDRIVTWDRRNRPTLWSLDESAVNADGVGRGRVARTAVGDGRYREVGLLDPRTGSLTIPDRCQDGDGAMNGPTFRVSSPRPVAELPPPDNHAFAVWLQTVLLDAANRGETVTVENGGLDVSPEPYAYFTCAREHEGTWLQYVEAAPPPRGSQLWPPQPMGKPAATLCTPATPEAVSRAALLLIDALSEWASSPLLLGLTFGTAPHGRWSLNGSA